MARSWLIGLVGVLMVLVACQPNVVLVEVTRVVESAGEETAVSPAPSPTPQVITITHTVPITTEVIMEVTVTPVPLGTNGRPVQLLFPPVANSTVISTRSQALVRFLQERTGRQFEIGILDSEQDVIELLCTAPQDTIGFLSALGYVLAHERCAVQAGLVAAHADGLTWQAGMIVTRRDGRITTLADLADKTWAIPDTNSLPNYFYFEALFQAENIPIGNRLELSGDSSAMLAVYNGEADFATGTFVPPIMPNNEPWVFGEDSPEIWRRLGIPPTRSPIGYVLVLAEPEFGGYRVRDARSGVFDTTPEIFNQTQILTLGAQIPNETIVLGADFPLGLAREVLDALPEFVASESCGASLCSADFYGWTAVSPVEDSFYNALRFILDELDLPAEATPEE